MTPHRVDEVAHVSRRYHCASPTSCYGCFVHTNGQVFCAGDNSYGQLGVGVRSQPEACGNDDDCAGDSECLENGYCHVEPTADPVNGLPPIQQVAVATRHVCARSEGGAVYCWGSQDGLAQRGPEFHCDQWDEERVECLAGAKRYSTVPLQVVFD